MASSREGSLFHARQIVHILFRGDCDLKDHVGRGGKRDQVSVALRVLQLGQVVWARLEMPPTLCSIPVFDLCSLTMRWETRVNISTYLRRVYRIVSELISLTVFCICHQNGGMARGLGFGVCQTWTRILALLHYISL